LKNRELALKFTEKYFPHARTVLITGSSAFKDNVEKFSDIDLVILDQSIAYIYAELVKFENVDFDVVIIPLSNLDSVIHNDIIIKRGKLLNMISTSEVIVDKDEIFNNLSVLCRKLFDLGPKQTPIHDLKKLYVIISGRIKDLKSNSDNLTIHFLVNEINQYLISLYFAKYNLWQGGARWNARIVNSNFPTLSELLIKSFSIRDGNDIDRYILLLERELNNFTTSIKSEKVSLIESKSPNIYGLNIKPHDYVNFIKLFFELKQKLKCEYGLSIIPNSDSSIDFTHIIELIPLKMKDEISVQELLPDYILIPIENYTDLTEIYLDNLLSYKKQLSEKSLDILVNHLSNFNDWNQDIGIFHSINLLMTCFKINNFTRNDVIDLCDFLSTKWIVYSNDNIPTTLHSIKASYDNKDNIVDIFFSTYFTQLYQNYSPIILSWEDIELEDDYSLLLREINTLLKSDYVSESSMGSWYNKSKFVNSPVSQFGILVWSDILKSQFQLFGVTSNNLFLIPQIVARLFSNVS
jgi:predicted nucleotidyltransferase